MASIFIKATVLSTREGTGILSTNPPLGVWTPFTLGANFANKTVLINTVSTFGTREAGVRETTGATGIILPSSFRNSTSYQVKADSTGTIELWRNNNGISFYHVSTLD